MMARPRQFDIPNALQKAMRVFWAKGYKASSLHDLTAAMGISKSSFYDTFGDKHRLYLSAIDHYDCKMLGWMVGILEGDSPPRQAIARVLDTVIDNAVAGSARMGCLLGNSAIEVSPHDEQVAAAVNKALGKIARAFYQAVVRGQQGGDISIRHEARPLARYLLAAVNGLLVIAKTNPDREVLADIAKVTLSALD